MTAGPKLYDISPPLGSELPVWPGDVPLSREITADMARGDRYTASALRATVHLGAHADAPAHYGEGGETIEACELETYVGPCRVLHLPFATANTVTPEQLKGAEGCERILLRTDSFWGRGPERGCFVDDFSALSPEALHWLADGGLRLIGIDTPSVDLATAIELPAHDACFRRDIRILEGIDLRNVAAGDYELIALPLPLVGFDGSPVRAVLKVV